MTEKLTPLQRAIEASKCAGYMVKWEDSIEIAIIAYLEAVAEDEASVEAARRAIEAHPAYDCGSTGDEEMARAVLATLLARAKEQP